MFRRLHFDRRLADGSAYRIRPSGPDDRELLLRCFALLSPDSRRMRFFTEKHTLTPDDLDRLCAADGDGHIAFAAVRIAASGQELEPLGFARCIRLSPGGELAEFSIATVDRIQGQGVGSALLAHLIPAARRQGIRRFRFEVLAGNTGMRRLAQQLGGTPKWVADGTLEYDCRLPEPVAATVGIRSTHPAGPVVTALPRGVPWYLDPGAWVEPWMASLGRFMPWTRAANEDVGPLLHREARLTDRPWRDAA